MDDTESLREVAALYAHIVDCREFQRLPEIMIRDTTITMYTGDPQNGKPLFTLDGLEAIQSGFELLRRYDTTFHFIGQTLVTELQTDHAACETYCIASHFHVRQERDCCFAMYIRYRDRLVREAGRWKFSERVLIVDRTTGEDVEQVA